MGNTETLCNLYSADGVLVEPEIHGRVEKGFFLADRDWTCYRRNYFTVVCSYSLKPATHSFPFYLKRTPTSQPENVLSFAMCISAVIDAPGGKTVELVQHTPKRDKGPQHRPSKVKLSPQPAASMGFSPNHNQQQQQQTDFGSFPQQTQLQNIASFERIQFKSATANNGKRRAAQQYYHLIIELYADVGSNGATGPTNPQTDAGWVKIACKVSAPMVVRGRSPGHYAEGGKVHSPGGNSGSGNGSNNAHSPASNGNGGMMGGSDMGASPEIGHNMSRLGMGSMHGFHNMSALPSNHTSPSSSSIRDPSISTPPPPHMDGLPIDPVITGDENGPIDQDYPGYQYYHGPIYHPEAQHHHSLYPKDMYHSRPSEGMLSTHVPEYDQVLSSPYMTSGVGSDGRRVDYRRCGDMGDGSRGYFPDLPTV
jgi:meiosis-specific transcription factor NDT80